MLFRSHRESRYRPLAAPGQPCQDIHPQPGDDLHPEEDAFRQGQRRGLRGPLHLEEFRSSRDTVHHDVLRKLSQCPAACRALADGREPVVRDHARVFRQTVARSENGEKLIFIVVALSRNQAEVAKRPTAPVLKTGGASPRGFKSLPPRLFAQLWSKTSDRDYVNTIVPLISQFSSCQDHFETWQFHLMFLQQ